MANDSEAQIGLDGIVMLKGGSEIVMESEDLYISEDKVRVAYRMLNPTGHDIAATVAFPLPRQPRGLRERYYEEDSKQDFTDFEFTTKVAGAPVKMTMIERAMIGDRDVTARLKELGLPLYWPDEEGLVEKMPEQRRAALRAEGLLVEEDPAIATGLVPAWDLATYFVREQVFPAHQAVSVEHEYVPMTGGSVGGALYPQQRKETPSIASEYARQYCTDQAFLAGVDRRLASARPGKTMYYGETWIGYVLTSGANWNGPIRDFRLVVDKGAPDNLVSFCMDGVKKIAPTRFEVRKRDFVPTRDLDVLILKFEEVD